MRTDCRGEGGEAGQRLGTGEFGQFFLAGNRAAALHFATRVFLAGNFSDKQRDKKQERAQETRGEESLERSRGRRGRKNFNEKLRTAERNTGGDQTVIYDGWLSGNVFLLNACLAASHVF